MYIQRTAVKEITSLCTNFKVILVSGMRRVGKRTLLQNLSTADRKYVTLERFADCDLAIECPSYFMKRNPLPLFIDEIQRVPSLLSQLKAEVDKSSASNQLWLSSSQHLVLMRNAEESLAGRLFEIRLMPLSLYEREGKALVQAPYLPSDEIRTHLPIRSNEETWRVVWMGGWPELVDKSAQERNKFFALWINNFLDQEIGETYRIYKDA